MKAGAPDLHPETLDLVSRTPSGEPITGDCFAATIALAAGVSPKVVSEQLGHASTAFTLDTYAHALPDMQDEAAARIEAMLIRMTA